MKNEDQESEVDGANENSNGDLADYSNITSYSAQSNIQEQTDIIVVVTSSDSEYSPYDAFNITQCDTFENLWMSDLLRTCSAGQDSCDCTYAEQLMEKNLLSCSDSPLCPTSCPVCLSCMKRLCGSSVLFISAARTGVRALPAAISLLSIVLAGCFFYSRKKKQGSGDLEENLMDTDSDRSISAKNWTVPVNNSGLPSEHGDTCKPVWLVPIKSQDSSSSKSQPISMEGTKKQDRKETAMLVVVPKPSKFTPLDKGTTTTNRTMENNADKSSNTKDSVFPDLLKGYTLDDNKNDPQDQRRNFTRPTSTKIGGEEFSPGLWLVPLSNESVASTISKSVDDHGDNASQRTMPSNIVRRDEGVRIHIVDNEEEGTCDHDECSSHSSLTDSAVSDGDILSVGTCEGEI
jgi:hypothetical protein